MIDEQAAYDQVPYPGGVFPETHPESLAVRAKLAGYTPPPVSGCRVLEIGCGTGTNLHSIAAGIPNGHLVGIDVSEVQIEMARSAGTGRVEFRAVDLTRFDASVYPPFNYVIAHGIYSWVATEVRQALMALIDRCLSPYGVAFVSYNVLPGWRLKQPARELMRFHTRGIEAPAARAQAARDILQFVAAPTVGFDDYKPVIGRSANRAAASPDWYLLHEEMGRHNEPIYFEAFAADCAAHHLKPIGDATVKDDLWMWLPPEIRGRMDLMSKTEVDRQQYLDFLTGRAFRKTVLVRDTQVPDGPVGPAAVVGMTIAGHPDESSRHDGAVTFSAPDVLHKLNTADPGLVAAFRLLRASWPAAVSFDRLAAVMSHRPIQTVAGEMFNSYQAGLISLKL